MLKLIYDVKCGFEEVYVVEKDVEEDLTYWINTTNESMLEAAEDIQKEDPEYKTEPYTEEELYEQYKDNPKELIEEVFSGMCDCIAESTVLEIAKTYFKHIC